jgi:hypothetical protein
MKLYSSDMYIKPRLRKLIWLLTPTKYDPYFTDLTFTNAVPTYCKGQAAHGWLPPSSADWTLKMPLSRYIVAF